MYGYTEILPGRITTDEIVCADGKSYLNLADNKLRMTNESETNSFDWNGSQLSLKGSIDVSGEAALSGWKFTNDLFCSQVQQNGYMEMNPEGSLLFKRASDGKMVGSLAHSGNGMTVKSFSKDTEGNPSAEMEISAGKMALKDSRQATILQATESVPFAIASGNMALTLYSASQLTNHFGVYWDINGNLTLDLNGGSKPLNVIMKGLPTYSSVPTGKDSGMLYKDSNGFLKIVP